MDDILRKSMLFDYYGELLTEKKRSVLELYYSDDLSLSEIAEDMGISRAAVFDALKSAEKKLEEYEAKLGLVAAYERKEELRERAHRALDGIRAAAGNDAGKSVRSEAEKLRGIIDELTDYQEEK